MPNVQIKAKVITILPLLINSFIRLRFWSTKSFITMSGVFAPAHVCIVRNLLCNVSVLMFRALFAR